ncbi:hypothetical protein HJC23_013490 [Cyclotella cryptica]|uniref:protein-serine/threonine phosphatase n=1 Tax=Cyclotella cryptica TaxID=29204 RepID=A0ABD3QBE1_9STRA
MSDEGNLIKLPAPPSTQLDASQSPPPSSLDAHIKWVVDSGSIVQQGEKIARLSYYPHGTLQSGLVSKADSALAPRSTIRARMKKRWVSGNEGADRSNTPKFDSAIRSGEENNVISIDVRSPFSGFLHVLYNSDIINNAIQINTNQQPYHYATEDIILAAVETCQHPALVGSLCAVCGTDTRASTTDLTLSDDDSDKATKLEQQQNRKILRREHGDSRLKKGFDGNGSETKSDTESNTCAVDNSLINQTNGNQNNAASKLNDSDSTCEMKTQTKHYVKTVPSNSSTIRSLSSLLSGARTTQEMQQPQRHYQGPLPRRNVNIERPPTTNYSNPESGSSDSKMTQMTVSGGVTLTISEAERKSISEADSKRLRQSKQLCLVLDLDHTLLHATDDYRAGRFVADEVIVDEVNEHAEYNGTKPQLQTKPNPQKRKDVRSIFFPLELLPAQYQQYIQRQTQEQQQYFGQNRMSLPSTPDQKHRHFVKLRPHLKEFFDSIQSTYKLSVYTAGTRAYAEKIAVMICRHLVGASLDEDGLNDLRAKVREKDDELKRYRARLERRQQLKSAKDRNATMGSNSPKTQGKTSKAKKKGVSFSLNSNAGSGQKLTTSSEDENGDSPPNKARKAQALAANELAPSLDAEGTSKSDDELLAQKINGSLNVNPDQAEDETLQSNPKRTVPQPEATNGVQIPRKKRRVQSDSLISLLAPPAKAETGESEEVEELIDPSEERDRLRKLLEEAEHLEVEATTLRRKLFGSRIVSRTDVSDLGTDVKSLKRVFPCGGVMAAIVDDREDVWANANDVGRPGEPPDNLLLVKPYHWKPFSGYRDVNNASGVDLSKSEEEKGNNKGQDNEENDVQLLWIADILKRLHERFYAPSLSQEERDQQTVPSLLRSMRQEILSQSPRANIVFSGVVPINQQNVQTKVRLPLIRYAEELGATVLPDITQDVTHVVAKRDNSDKIKRARAEIPGCYIVSPSWLMECYWSISRRDVGPHHMGAMPEQKHKAEVASNRILLGESEDEKSEEDDIDDDFADDLENEMMMVKD